MWANEKPSDTYQKAEKALNDVANKSLRSNLTDRNYPGLVKDAEAVQASFAVMLDYWKGKNVEDAMTYVQTGIKAAEDLKTAAAAMNYNGVLEAQNALAGSNGRRSKATPFPASAFAATSRTASGCLTARSRSNRTSGRLVYVQTMDDSRGVAALVLTGALRANEKPSRTIRRPCR